MHRARAIQLRGKCFGDCLQSRRDFLSLAVNPSETMGGGGALLHTASKSPHPITEGVAPECLQLVSAFCQAHVPVQEAEAYAKDIGARHSLARHPRNLCLLPTRRLTKPRLAACESAPKRRQPKSTYFPRRCPCADLELGGLSKAGPGS